MWLYLYFEVIGGFWECLFVEEVDLIIYYVDKSDLCFEWMDLMEVVFMLVVVFGYVIVFFMCNFIFEQMQVYVQVVICDMV